MENNDLFRRLRYVLDFSDAEMIQVFKLAKLKVDRAELSNWLKKEDDELLKEIEDIKLASFLNGLIIKKRGKQDSGVPEPEQKLNNNMIFKKLKIAFNLKSDEVMALFKSINKHIGPHELTAFMRKPTHPKYKTCNDQYLRHFLNGLQQKYRTPELKNSLKNYKKK